MTNVIGTIFILLAIYGMAASAGLFAERSGVINLAIEGGMIFGALVYALVGRSLADSHTLNIGDVILSFLCATLAGILASMLLGLGSITLKGNQVVIGTAINILAPIISLVIIESIEGATFLNTLSFQIIASINFASVEPWVRQIIIGCIVLVILVIVWIIFNQTSFGIRLKTAGENPAALTAVGISVTKMRYIALIISGAFMGIAGGLAVSAYSIFTTYTSTVYGMGFIAIAILILGQWKVWGVVLGAFAFSIIYGVVENYLVSVGTYSYLLQTIPYLATIFILPFIGKFAVAPKSVGIPY